MRNLLEFLAKYNYWLVFVLLEVVCFTLLFRFNDYQGSVWFTSANTVVGKVLTWRSQMTAYWDLREINRELVTRNHELELQNSLLRQEIQKARLDSTRIYAELQKEWANSLFVEARVVGNSVRNKDNYITIDRGEADGVKPEMGVVCGTGLVGIVYLTSAHYSVVIPVLNSKSGISCRLRNTDYFGQLRWKGGNPLHAVLQDVPQHAQVEVGDVVETSGFSDIFPPGLFVGRVTRIANAGDGLSYQLEVSLSTDFSSLRDVCVISNYDFIERKNLKQLNQKVNKGI
ncbi:MAG: rod shape-determining protein MreC [Paraprevotella sp.]|nr:rod shape-determining protein MreC [Paraprevotella sp.]